MKYKVMNTLYSCFAFGRSAVYLKMKIKFSHSAGCCLNMLEHGWLL